MDDPKNSQYSRAPKIEDIVSICRSLNEQGVRYLIIGGFAVIFHGFVRGTKDIDLLIDPSIENIQKAKKALAFLPDNAIALIQDDEVAKYHVIRVGDEVTIDLMAKACGIDYNEASKSMEYATVDNVEIPIPTKEGLIRMKDTIRPSDKVDVDFLQWRIKEEKK